jgi:hypothetical protein
MSATSITLICFGLLVILTRGPLIFAPGPVRDIYLNMVANQSTMRVFGVGVGAVSLVVIWATRFDVGLASEIVSGFFWFLAAMSALVLIPFPGLVSRIGTPIWANFNDMTLRFLGLLSVAIAGWIVYQGLYLG